MTDYRVLASYGHVRDLPENPGKGKFGVDVDHDFAPEYVISEDRRKQVDDIEKAARGSDIVYLATDLDREGEAIAWHVAEAANVPDAKTRRVTFSEITEPAIREAFANPRDIDQNLVDAQQTRRIVDRLVGYTLSPLLSRKVRGGLSAGRVQSVAVRLVVEREREIEAFTAREYWTIEAILATAAGETFAAELVRIDGEALAIADEADATASRRGAPRRSARSSQGRRPDPEAIAGAAVHDLDAPAGGQPQAVVQPEADDVDRPAAVRGRRHAGRPRRAHHLHAHRLDRDRRRRHGRGPRRHRRALRRAVHDAQGPGLQDEGQGRPGGARVDPADVVPSATRTRSRPAQARGAAAVPAHLAARPGLADGAQGARDDDRRAGRRPYELRASATKTLFEGFARVYTEGRDDGAEDDEEEGSGACRPWPRATSRPSATSPRRSTSPSRRRASPRRP